MTGNEMLLKDYASKLVQRFDGLDKFPGSNAAVDELIKAMMEAPHIDAAKHFVDDWLRDHRRAPLPCDLYQAFKPTKMRKLYENFPSIPPFEPGQAIPPPEYFCNQCGDTGWYIVQLPQKTADSGVHYTAAKRCPHPLSERGSKER